jgi:uncharacterized protein (DUF1684 family)
LFPDSLESPSSADIQEKVKTEDGRLAFRQFVQGYAITSYASQGKSVDYVLFSDSAAKAATNQQQWYVTISRGKKGIHIFTTDKGSCGRTSPAAGIALRW